MIGKRASTGLLRKNFRETPTCASCSHVFVLREFEEFEDATAYYCTLGAPPRPPCGSMLLQEEFSYTLEVCDKQHKRWDKWANGREVWATTICDCYAESTE